MCAHVAVLVLVTVKCALPEAEVGDVPGKYPCRVRLPGHSRRSSDLARPQVSWDISVLGTWAVLAPFLTRGGVLRIP